MLRYRWLVVAGGVSGAVYGVVSTWLNTPDSSGVLWYSAAFGAIIGVAVGGLAGIASFAAYRLHARPLIVGASAGIGASVAWAALFLWTTTSTTTSLSAADWLVAVGSTGGCVFLALIISSARQRAESR